MSPRTTFGVPEVKRFEAKSNTVDGDVVFSFEKKPQHPSTYLLPLIRGRLVNAAA